MRRESAKGGASATAACTHASVTERRHLLAEAQLDAAVHGADRGVEEMDPRARASQPSLEIVEPCVEPRVGLEADRADAAPRGGAKDAVEQLQHARARVLLRLEELAHLHAHVAAHIEIRCGAPMRAEQLLERLLVCEDLRLNRHELRAFHLWGTCTVPVNGTLSAGRSEKQADAQHHRFEHRPQGASSNRGPFPPPATGSVGPCCLLPFCLACAHCITRTQPARNGQPHMQAPPSNSSTACALCPPFNRSSGLLAPGVSKAVERLRRSCSCPTLQLGKQEGPPPACARPRLLLKHFPKAGGTFARGVIGKAVGAKLLIVKGEFDGVRADDWRRHFVVGLVREPCAYYVSLFAFGSSRPAAGAFSRSMYAVYGKQAASQAYGQTPPYDGPDDVRRFRRWVRRDDVRGVMYGRFLSEYGRQPFVDCWANTANLSATLRSCVHEFAQQGGRVDWDAFAAAERLAHEHRRSPNAGENASPHAACEAYYDDDLARAVTLGFDATVYAQLGFSGCCAHTCARCGTRVSAVGTGSGTGCATSSAMAAAR